MTNGENIKNMGIEEKEESFARLFAQRYKEMGAMLRFAEKESGAKVVATFSADEAYNEGVFILRGGEKLCDMLGVKKEDIKISNGEGYKKGEFELYGLKYAMVINPCVEGAVTKKRAVI